MNNEEKILQMLEQINNRFETEMNEIKSEIKNIKSDISDLKTGSKQIQSDIADMKTDIKYIKINQTEHTNYLTALIERTDVQKAETIKLSGSIEGLRNDMNVIEQVSGKNLIDIAALKTAK